MTVDHNPDTERVGGPGIRGGADELADATAALRALVDRGIFPGQGALRDAVIARYDDALTQHRNAGPAPDDDEPLTGDEWADVEAGLAELALLHDQRSGNLGARFRHLTERVRALRVASQVRSSAIDRIEGIVVTGPETGYSDGFAATADQVEADTATLLAAIRGARTAEPLCVKCNLPASEHVMRSTHKFITEYEPDSATGGD